MKKKWVIIFGQHGYWNIYISMIDYEELVYCNMSVWEANSSVEKRKWHDGMQAWPGKVHVYMWRWLTKNQLTAICCKKRHGNKAEKQVCPTLSVSSSNFLGLAVFSVPWVHSCRSRNVSCLRQARKDIRAAVTWVGVWVARPGWL